MQINCEEASKRGIFGKWLVRFINKKDVEFYSEKSSASTPSPVFVSGLNKALALFE